VRLGSIVVEVRQGDDGTITTAVFKDLPDGVDPAVMLREGADQYEAAQAAAQAQPEPDPEAEVTKVERGPALTAEELAALDAQTDQEEQAHG